MGLINLGIGLAAAGQSVADMAGKMGLSQQQSDLEKEKLLLADQLQQGRDRSLFAHQDSNLATTEAGQDRRLDKSESGATARTNISEAGQDRRLDVSEKGANKRNADNISANKSDVAGSIEDADGNVSVYTRGGEFKDSGRKTKPKGAQTDNELVDNAIKLNTTENFDPKTFTTTKVINHAAAADTLKSWGRADLAKGAISASAAAPPPGDQGVPVPPAFAGKPDGTVLHKDGQNFVMRGGKLFPQ